MEEPSVWTLALAWLHGPALRPLAAHWRRLSSSSSSPLPSPAPPQARNYQKRKEAEAQRRAMFDAALAKFKGGKVEEVGVGGRLFILSGWCSLGG